MSDRALLEKCYAQIKFLFNESAPLVVELRERLAQPEPEPVAHMYPWELDRFEQEETFAHAYSIAVGCPEGESVPLYRAPPKRDEPPCRTGSQCVGGKWIANREAQREWVGLTDEEITHAWEKMGRGLDKYTAFARAIEAALKAKNE